MEIKNRKNTRYEHADYSSMGAYFITVCTNERKRLLSEVDIVGDGLPDVPCVKLTDYGEIVEAQIAKMNDAYTDIFIDQYVIMPDHVHMIIILYNDKEVCTDSNGTSGRPSPTGLADRPNERIPKAISTFKRFINKRIGENIWQRSYNDHIIRCRKDYESVQKYIYENPIKWFYGEEEEEYKFEY